MSEHRERARNDHREQYMISKGVGGLAMTAGPSGENKDDRIAPEAISDKEEAILKTVSVRVSFRGGEVHRSFRHVPFFRTSLNQVSTTSKLRAMFEYTPRIKVSLEEIYGLDVYTDHKEAIFLYTDESGLRKSAPLNDLEETTIDELAEWKNRILCSEPSDEYPKAEIHVILKVDKLMGKAAELHEANIVNRDTIADLERKIEDLESRNLALQLTQEDLDAAAGIGGRLRKRKKTARFSE